jgi:hypothetical protein
MTFVVPVFAGACLLVSIWFIISLFKVRSTRRMVEQVLGHNVAVEFAGLVAGSKGSQSHRIMTPAGDLEFVNVTLNGKRARILCAVTPGKKALILAEDGVPCRLPGSATLTRRSPPVAAGRVATAPPW